MTDKVSSIITYRLVVRHPHTDGPFIHHFISLDNAIAFVEGSPDGIEVVSVEKVEETRTSVTVDFVNAYNAKVRHDPQI